MPSDRSLSNRACNDRRKQNLATLTVGSAASRRSGLATDMRAFHAAKTGLEKDEIAAGQLHALRAGETISKPRGDPETKRRLAPVKHKLKDTEVTHAELAKRLRKHGLRETEASITNKLARGTFPATFFLACIAALE